MIGQKLLNIREAKLVEPDNRSSRLVIALDNLSLKQHPPWLAAGLVEFCLVWVSTWLWRWGQNREAMARNPLQGGLIEATLRARYGRPQL